MNRHIRIRDYQVPLHFFFIFASEIKLPVFAYLILFINSKDNVYVECNATFCQKYYTTQAGHTKRQIIDPVWIIIIDPVSIMKQAKTRICNYSTYGN
jgi:hypothetical protein